MFQMGKDDTEYYLLSKEGVSVGEFEGNKILKVSPEALTMLANQAFRDVNFLLRRSHNEQVAKILSDPEASDNDKYVALTFLRNAEVACKGKLPFCQDTGTAIIHGEKGQHVWTGFCDEEALSKGVYKTYTEENLRYSQNAPLSMYEEINTRCNLPAQIDIEATEGCEYKFLCVVKGGGSANKTYFYQETKARIQNPGTLVPFLVEKMKTALPTTSHSSSAERLPRRISSLSSSPQPTITTTCPPPVTRLDAPSATWNWRNSSSTKPTRLDWERSSEENISHTTYV